MEKLKWKIATYELFKEILGNPNCVLLTQPINILLGLLRETAQRCTEINDPKLNALMIRLGLYDISNPSDPKFDQKLVEKYLKILENDEK